MVFIFLKIITMIAKPTATSAAATAIIKNTKTCPLGSDLYDEKAISKRLTALSISSMDINIMMAFFLIKTPTIPIVNSIVAKSTKFTKGTCVKTSGTRSIVLSNMCL